MSAPGSDDPASSTGSENATGLTGALRRVPVHPKSLENLPAPLGIGSAEGLLEREADRVSSQVVHTPEPRSGGIPSRGKASPDRVTGASGSSDRIQQKSRGSGTRTPDAVWPDIHGVLCSSGQPLDPTLRSSMEQRLGQDFRDVRVHADAAAERSALALDANAYAVGHHIVFGEGRLDPGTGEGRRLIAHELTHVVQQRHAVPLIQREPRGKGPKAVPPREELPQYKSTDPVVDFKAVVGPRGDAWELTVDGDFPTPEAIGHLLWPTRDHVPPSVSIEPVFIVEVDAWRTGQEKTPPAAHARRGTYRISGVYPITLRSMDPLFAKMFTDLGVLEESESIKAARLAFRKRHSGYDTQVLDNIDNALKRVTRNNPDLLEAYYRFFSSDWAYTDDLPIEGDKAGDTGQTSLVTRPDRTAFNPGVLHLMKLPRIPTDDELSLLGATLIHEFVHTSHPSDVLKGPGEGKAYGVENFFNERMGDKKRDEASLDLGARFGDKKIFNSSYFIMKELYQIIDGRPSRIPSLKGVSVQRARELSVEFISKSKEDFSDQLKNFIVSELGQSAFDSLPSQEHN